MAFVDFECFIPQYPHYGNDSMGRATEGLGSGGSSRAKAVIFQAPKTGNLEKVGFILWTVVSAQDLRISFRDVDANGDPTGADTEWWDLASGSQSAQAFVETGAITDDGTDTGTRRAVTQGEWVALVFDYVSTDGNATLLTNFQYGWVQSTSGNAPVPYMAQDVSSWARLGDAPAITLRYDDDSLEFLGVHTLCATARNDHSYNSASSPDEVGVRFQLPLDVKVSGAWLMVDGNADIDVKLYEDDDTLIDSISLDRDADSQQTGERVRFVFFSDRHELSKDTWYRLTILPTNNTVTFPSWDFDSNAIMAHCGIPGVNWYGTARTDAGSWTNTDTRRFLAGGLIVTAVNV